MADLVTRSRLDDSDFNRGLARMRKGARDFNRQLAAVAVRAFAPAALTAGIVSAGRAAIENADRIQDMADRYRETAEDIQKVGNVARVMGTDVDSVLPAIKKLRLSLIEAADGGREQNEALAAMGLHIQDLQGLALPDLLVKISQGFQRAELAGRGVHSIVKLMGRSADELVPMLGQSADSLQGIFDASRVASNAAVQGVANVADAWQRLRDDFKSGSIEAASWAVRAAKWAGKWLPGAEGRRQSKKNIQDSRDRMAAEEAERARNAPEAGKPFVAGEESGPDRARRESETNARLGAEWLRQEEARQEAGEKADQEVEGAARRRGDEARAEFEAKERQYDLEMQIATLRGSNEERARKEAELRVRAARAELDLATGTAQKKAAALALAQAEANLANQNQPGASKEDRIRGYIENEGMTASQARRRVRVEDRERGRRQRTAESFDRREARRGRKSLIDDVNRPEDLSDNTRAKRGHTIMDAGVRDHMESGGAARAARDGAGQFRGGDAAADSGQGQTTILQSIQKSLETMASNIARATGES